MSFQKHINQIHWKVHFSSSIDKVFNTLTTDKGRETFWAQKTLEQEDIIEFNIQNYPIQKVKIKEIKRPYLFKIEYFGTDVQFELQHVTPNGTDLYLTALTPNDKIKWEMTAGWVSVLMAMKAAVDFGVDLRNHDPMRGWDNGYLDN